MKEIQLTKSAVALVDDEDFERLNQWKWHVFTGGSTFYATRTKCKPRRITIRMHREILGLLDADKREIDHKNGNGLDNRRENLRICSRSQNQCNKPKCSRPTSSKYKGVVRNKKRKRWVAYIWSESRFIFIGHFIDETNAALAYDAKAKELHGEFALLNFPE